MKKQILSILLTLCMVLCLVPISVFAEGETGVALDGINFPDATFRTYIAERFDTDKDGNLSDTEIAAVTKIECYERGIGDLTGIEHFTALTYLDCDSNPINKLNVSSNTALEHLLCSGTGLTVLDVSRHTALKELRCNRNRLTVLDVSHNTALEELQCNDNQLTTLDVSQNTALKKLQFGGNKLTSWDITNNVELEELACDGAGLTALDVSHNTALKDLWCHDNQLTALDVSKNINLKRLCCDKNLLAVLDVSHNAALETLYCEGNRLTSMDLSRNTELTSYYCADNTYQIVLDENRTFDLSTLPGSFDVSKARNWKGGNVSGTILTVPNDRDTITYDYLCGKYERTFTLTCSKARYTVTFLGGQAAAQTVFHGEKAIRPANPIIPGLRFLGWYEGYSLYNFDTPVTQNITLNDGWELCDHSGSTAKPTCTTSVTCTECSGTIAALGHDFSASVWQYDKDTHWKKCARCEAKNDENPHDWDSGKVTVKPTCMTAGEKVYTCDKCGAAKIESIQANGHNWGQEWQHDAAHHWHECLNADCDVRNNDSAKDGYGAHTGGTATCTEKAICELCVKAYGELDANNHSNLKHIDAKAATKDAEGNIEYWYCEGCNKYYSDAAATKEIKKTGTVTEKLPDEPKSPRTGDSSNLMLWFSLLFISEGVCTALTVKRKKSH